MLENVLYEDKLVLITNESITLKNYYFPSFKPNKILLNKIQMIEVLNPTITNGKWRIHGTGNFRVWFPYDVERPKRDKIFRISIKNKWVKCGFTVENSSLVQNIFENKKLIHV